MAHWDAKTPPKDDLNSSNSQYDCKSSLKFKGEVSRFLRLLAESLIVNG